LIGVSEVLTGYIIRVGLHGAICQKAVNFMKMLIIAGLPVDVEIDFLPNEH
jgi:hypothetical protein